MNRTRLAEALFADGRAERDIAAVAGVNPCTLSNIKNGHRTPSIETSYRIAFALGKTPEELDMPGLGAILEAQEGGAK